MSKVTQLLSGEWGLDPRPSPPNPRLFLSFHFLTREKRQGLVSLQQKTGGLETCWGFGEKLRLKAVRRSKGVSRDTGAGPPQGGGSQLVFSPKRKKSREARVCRVPLPAVPPRKLPAGSSRRLLALIPSSPQALREMKGRCGWAAGAREGGAQPACRGRSEGRAAWKDISALGGEEGWRESAGRASPV